MWIRHQKTVLLVRKICANKQIFPLLVEASFNICTANQDNFASLPNVVQLPSFIVLAVFWSTVWLGSKLWIFWSGLRRRKVERWYILWGNTSTESTCNTCKKYSMTAYHHHSTLMPDRGKRERRPNRWRRKYSGRGLNVRNVRKQKFYILCLLA